jgi:hypothetical protein
LLSLCDLDDKERGSTAFQWLSWDSARNPT